MTWAALFLLVLAAICLLLAAAQVWVDRLDPDRLDRLNETRRREGVPNWRTR
jgi:hypothetical protein